MSVDIKAGDKFYRIEDTIEYVAVGKTDDCWVLAYISTNGEISWVNVPHNTFSFEENYFTSKYDALHAKRSRKQAEVDAITKEIDVVMGWDK